MCGRFALGSSNIRIRRVFRGERRELEWIQEDAFQPRYNVAPRSNAPVIRRRDGGATDDSSDPSSSDDLLLHTMKWGVIPHWSKHEQTSLNTINARAENLVQSGGMWSSMKAKKRCIVICDGYFEWLKKQKSRIPYFIRRKDEELMLLAGLYDCATLEGSSTPLWTFTIVTTDASPTLSWLHDRQPVILSSLEQASLWLDTTKGWHSGLVDLLKPGDGSSDLECYQVPQEVGRVGTNSPELIRPVSQRKDGIEAMFSRQRRPDTSKHKFEGSSSSSFGERGTTCEAIDADEPSESPPPKKRKIEVSEENTLSSAESIHTSAAPSTPTKSKKRLSSKSPKAAKTSLNSNSKITSFFQRK